MAYNDENRSKMYYCAPGSSVGGTTRLVPAPQISISPEIYYANDTVIGYTYNIKLTGYADALRRDEADGVRSSGIINSGVEQVFSHMNDIRDIFNGNGGNLYLYDTGNKLVLQGKGATIKSIKFDESDNRWFNYASYTVDLEFNEIDFLGCNDNTVIPCTGSFFHTDQPKVTTSDNLVDFKKYKLKNFNDKWTFNLDNEVYTQKNFKVTYTISATGKHYYDSSGQLIPAWLQAKEFVQDRLYTQIKALIDGAVALSNTDDKDGCSATLSAEELYDQNTDKSLFKDFDNGTENYKIYNEVISCNTSESAGSFSVTYNAIISAQDLGAGDGNNATHTHTQSISTTNDGTDYSTTLSVQGTVQGMIRGGIIDVIQEDFDLPQQGTFLTKYNGETTKYDNALASYYNYIGGNTDLGDGFKNDKDITQAALLIKNGNGTAIPSSFVLDHNYHEGSISYSAQYDSKLNRGLSQGYMNISIVKNDPTPIINEFVIPGRGQGPLIQWLGAYTPKTISISIEGANQGNKGCSLSDLCSSVPDVGDIFNQLSSYEGSTVWIKTSEQYNKNAIDGSFSMNVDYTCTENIY